MILVNGQNQNHIDVADRGLHYGDGLFETIAVNDGQPRLWERHWRRLSMGCRRLGLAQPEPGMLWEEASRVCCGVDRGVLKIILTRGAGGRGYHPPQTGQATRIMATYPWPAYPEANWRQGVAVRLCTTRLGRNSALAGMKHLNRLEQVLARSEWEASHIAEGLMLDDDDHIIAGTMSNLFIVTAQGLLTPVLTACGVAGVMRSVILDLATELDIAWQEAPLRLEDLHRADEVFLSNALIGIWPVRRIEQRDYGVGSLTELLGGRLKALLGAISG
jgi:4-amino-4-deoxychorismate lyase